MAPFDETSMLHGLDSDDIRALRRVMNGVLRRLAGTARDDPAHRHGLEDADFQVVEQIVDEANNNALVRNAAIRFASMHMAPANDVSRFAQEFNIVVQPGIVGPVNLRDAEDVQKAQAAFDNFVQNGPAVVYPTGADGDPMLLDESDTEEDLENFKMESSEAEATPLTTGKKRKRGIKSEPESSPVKKKSGHEPKKPRGFRSINEGQDRSIRAIVNEPDPALFIMRFNCEKDIKGKPGVVVRGPSYFYNFLDHVDKFDWSDKDQVKRLNDWRQQIFTRNFGALRATRYQYTTAEQNELFNILKEHLATPEVGGRWKLINWDYIAGKLNQAFHGRVFTTRDDIAQTTYPRGHEGWVNSDPSKKFTTSHSFVDREATGIHNQMSHFTHPIAKKIIAAAKKADEEYYASLADGDKNGKAATTSPPPTGSPKMSKSEGKKKAVDKSDGAATSSKKPIVIDKDEDVMLAEALATSRREKEKNDQNKQGESSKKAAESSGGASTSSKKPVAKDVEENSKQVAANDTTLAEARPATGPEKEENDRKEKGESSKQGGSSSSKAESSTDIGSSSSSK